MSFETWRQSVYPHGLGSAEKYARNAWEYCRAESEAEIAALQEERDVLAQGYVAPEAELIAILSPLSVKNVPTSVIELTEKAMAQIAALQAERNNWLREALKMTTSHLKDPLLSSCLCEWCQLTRTLLSTPASGEPARKP